VYNPATKPDGKSYKVSEETTAVEIFGSPELSQNRPFALLALLVLQVHILRLRRDGFSTTSESRQSFFPSALRPVDFWKKGESSRVGEFLCCLLMV